MFCGAIVYQQRQMTILATVVALQGVVMDRLALKLLLLSIGTLRMEGRHKITNKGVFKSFLKALECDLQEPNS